MLCVLSVVGIVSPVSAQEPPDTDQIGTNPNSKPAPEQRALAAELVAARPVSPFITVSGSVSLSVDAVGTNDPAGDLVTIEKPAGATVRNAYLLAASTGFTNYEPQDGDITLGGIAIDWDPARTMTNGISSVNVFADVTGNVRNAIDDAEPGPVRFRVAEGSRTFSIDGAILAVIFDDPNVDVPATVVLAYGAQQVTGDRIRLVRPTTVPTEDVEVRLGVGISYGFQPSAQDNQVNVNGTRISTSAGGQDDGQGANGALITVGGTGDDPANPTDPFARGSAPDCPRCDDEYYDLQPFLAAGPISELELTTVNPSADDNFFFASLEVVGATATWTPSQSRNPLVVLHGITGSYLEDGNGDEVWPDEGETADKFNDEHLDVLALADNGVDPADPDDEISVSTGRGIDGLIAETELCTPIYCKHLSDVYKPMFRILEEDYGYTRGQDLFPFAFDWRLSSKGNGELLNDFIDEVLADTGATQVNLVSHSQGGLVTRNALESPRSVGKVERVTTLGTPNLGATKLHGVLDLRQPCQADAPVGCFLNRSKAQELTTNWPGALELLPSRAFFDAYESSIRRDIDDDGDGRVEGFLSFAQVRDTLADRNLDLIDAATALHQIIDPWDPADSEVDLMRIVGINGNTIVRIRQFEKEQCSGILWWRDCELVETFEFEMGDGDGTVPRRSASLLGGGLDISGGAKVCNVWGPDSGHGELPNNELVLAITLDYLERDDYRCEPRPELAEAAVQNRAAIAAQANASSPNAGEDGIDLYTTELLVRGPVTGAVERLGTGGEELMGIVDNAGTPIEVDGIDGGTYTTSPGSVSYSVSAVADYLGRWTTTEDGEIALVLRSYDGTITRTVSSVPTPIPAGAVLGLAFNHPVGTEVSVTVDDDGDGTVDRSIPIGQIVAGEGAADTIAPISNVSVSPVGDDVGMVEVTIEASDQGGSGVAAIQYALDATGESNVYNDTFRAPALGELYVRAVDKAGNVEAPYQVVVLDDHPSRPDLVDEFETVQFNESGVLGYEGDIDNWGVRIAEAGRYRFQLMGLQADYDLRLLSTDGTEIVADPRRGTRSETIEAELEPGDYLLEVTGFDGAFLPDKDYRLLGVAVGPPS